MATVDVTLERLDDQIGWYDRKSSHNQRWFKIVKVVQLAAAGTSRTGRPTAPRPRR